MDGLTKKPLLPFLLTLILISSCQVAPIRVEPVERKALKELEEYSSIAIKGEAFSTSTLLRLAEDCFAEEESLMKEKYADYERDKELYAKGKLKTEPLHPMPDHTRLLKILSSVEEIFRAKGEMDKIVYTTGYALFEQGSASEAVAVFENFLNSYKESAFFTEVAFRLGELYFEQDDLAMALKNYTLILDSPESPFYRKALYKMGWIHYKLNDFKSAIAYFSRLAEDTLTPEDAIGKESLNNIAMVIKNMKFPQEAESAIHELAGKSYTEDLILSIGSVLNEEERYSNALDVYGIFIKLYPDSPNLPLAYRETAAILELLDKPDPLDPLSERVPRLTPGALEWKKSIVEKFNPEVEWYKKRFKPPDTKSAKDEKTDIIVGAALLDIGDYYHNEAKNTGNDAYLKKAIESYELYVKYFPQSEKFKEVNLLLADSLFEDKNYNESALRHETAMRLYVGEKKGEDAAMSALLSIELIINSGIFKEDVLSEATNRIKEFYLREFKIKTGLVEFLNKVSHIYAALGRYDEAIEVLVPLLESPGRYKTYEKTGDLYVLKKDFLKAIDSYSKALYEIHEIGESEDAEIRKKLSNLHYVVAEDYHKNGAYKEAAEYYFKAFSTFKESTIAEDSLGKIALIYLSMGDFNGFWTVEKTFEKNYPLSNRYLTLLVDAAKSLEEGGSFTEASVLFEKAIKVTAQASEKEMLLFKTASLFEKTSDYKRLKDILSQGIKDGMISEAGLGDALLRISVAEIKLKELSDAKKTLAIIIKERKDTPYGVMANFIMAGLKTEDYLKFKIEYPFQKSFDKKNALMKELLNDYTSVVKTKTAQLLPESFYQMGVILENFSAELIASEMPRGMTKEELKEYEFLLEEKAYPFELDAIEAYRNAMKASIEHTVEKRFIAMSLERLSALMPALYKREFEDVTAAPLFIKGAPLDRDIAGVSQKEKSALRNFKDGLKNMEKAPQEAIKDFSLALMDNPEFAEAKHNRGLIFYRLGDKKSAGEEFLKAIKISPRLNDAYNALAIIQVEDGKIEEARKTLHYAITVSPHPSTLINLAGVIFLEGDLDGALEYYKRAEEIDADNQYLNHNMALLFFKKGNSMESKRRIEKSLILNALHPETLIMLAKIALMDGNVKEALGFYEDISGKMPLNAALHKDIGIIYELYLNDYAAAKERYKRYMELNGEKKELVGEWLLLVEERLKR